ncbi:MAG: hypothetical protein H7259_01715, partial [Cytophagales bacterium]|nr:hypothetical protein [Cytophaga sp.]
MPLFSKSILAADFGSSYEYKSLNHEHYATPYLFKFSTSIRNFEKIISYESANNSNDYNINVSTISVNEFKDVKTSNDLLDTLRSIINLTNIQSATYKTKLPSTFMMMADYQVYKNC